MSAPLLLAGMSYAERGWPVFVLGPTKFPIGNCTPCRDADDTHDRETCSCLTCHGFYAATTDPDRIESMFANYPHGLLAIRTGAPSGLVVVDVDVAIPDDPTQIAWETITVLEDLGLLPDTATVITGSGGMHLLYAHPGGRIPNGAGKLGPKVDIRGDGGYIVAAPSIHPRTKRAYRWGGRNRSITPLHPLLADRLREKSPAPPRVFATDHKPTAPGRLAGLMKTVINAPEGERNQRLYWAACRAGEMAQEGLITESDAVWALVEAGRAAGLSDKEMTGNGQSGSIASGIRAARTGRIK